MIRPMKVAGSFYPDDPVVLQQMLDLFFQNIEKPLGVQNLKAVVAPHAGYIYSGPVAAYSYQAIKENLNHITKNIIIMSPDHYIGMNKVLVGNYDELQTPFGNLKGNPELANYLITQSPEIFTDKLLTYDQEHAIETQLPFLKYILQDKSNKFKVLPLIFGQVDIQQVVEILKNLDDVFFIVSSDLSHYHPYEEAKQIDAKSLEILLSKDLSRINEVDACGIYPWASLTILAILNNWKTKLLKYANSGDTAGDKSAVVGYASVAYYN